MTQTGRPLECALRKMGRRARARIWPQIVQHVTEGGSVTRMNCASPGGRTDSLALSVLKEPLCIPSKILKMLTLPAQLAHVLWLRPTLYKISDQKVFKLQVQTETQAERWV